MGNHSHTFPHSDTLQGESPSLPEDPSRRLHPGDHRQYRGPGQSRRCIAGLRTNSTAALPLRADIYSLGAISTHGHALASGQEYKRGEQRGHDF